MNGTPEQLNVSVVIIARNEEAVIGSCIASVLDATRDYRSDVVFVDSASVDRTVEVASRYPVGIVRLAPEAPLSPSAGRWLGTRLTVGEYVFFVDGDMIVIDGWIARAIDVLSDRGIGGVGGRLYWNAPGETLAMDRADDFPLGTVPGLGGAAVYRRSALESCGGFNPFLRGEEERELAYRLSRKGYAVVRIDHPMAYHLDKQRTVSEIREQSMYFSGVGQIMRRHAFREIFWDLLREHREVFGVWTLGALVLVLAVLLAANNAVGALALVAGTVFLALAVLALLKGPQRLGLYMHSRVLLSIRFAKGFARGLRRPEHYPDLFTRVKDGTGTDRGPTT